MFDAIGVGAGSNVFLAISGSSDPTALAQTAVSVYRREGTAASSLIADYGWREGSVDEAMGMCGVLEVMGVESVDVVRVESEGGDSLESVARAVRCTTLAEAARLMPDRAVVVCGYTVNDQTEIVLMGSGRGSGSRSIAGMPVAGARSGAPDVPPARPFLGLRRVDLHQALVLKGVKWVEGPMNDVDSPVRAVDGSLLCRAVVRHHCMPTLEDSFGPGMIEALARAAVMIRKDLSALDGFVEETDMKLGAKPSVRELTDLSPILRTRILCHHAIDGRAKPGELISWYITTPDPLVSWRHGRSSLDLPGMKVTIDEDRVTFDRAVPVNREENCGSN